MPSPGSGTPGGALSSLRVLDVSTLFAGPATAAILADFGADVVKVELPGGDPLRAIGAQRDGHSLPWALVARNKRVITVDPARGDILRRLVAVADIVVLNQPRPLLETWRCTPDDIAAVNPGAVVVWATAYGATGPYAARPGNGTLGEAFGGFTHMTGQPDGPPVLPSAPLGDVLTGIAGALGALVACYWRDAGGGTGQLVDVSMFEPVIAVLGTAMAAWSPGSPPPARTGSRVPGGVPRNVYRAGDGRWVALSGTTDAQVARLLPLLGLDPHDGWYAGSAERLKNGDELDALVADWVGARPAADVVAALDAARIPVTLVNDLATLSADPHVQARGSIATVDDNDLGPVLMPAPFPHLSGTPGAIAWAGRPAGADTDSVCRDWLGLGPSDTDALRRSGAIS
ncbi:MAG TPA: CoA transferase [Acidimicrobiales bacterium]|nr:CoA transferase [Acidimicrobiales bacterium]